MAKIKDKEFYTYKYGFTYAHTRKPWVFDLSGRLVQFKFGADWWFNKRKLEELNIYLGFFELSWTRCF